MSEDEGPNLFNILLYMAAGGFVTYLWLNKAKTQVKTTDMQTLLYSQNNELLDQLKVLNETLIKRDNLLNEYQKSVQQQYQNIPTVIGSTINTELQQIALYLDAVNTQLEKISSQIKQMLETPNHSRLAAVSSESTPSVGSHPSASLPVSLTDSRSRQYQQQKNSIRKESIMSPEPIPIHQKKYQNKTNNLKNDTKEIDDDKWSVKRGTDGRIKSLENI